MKINSLKLQNFRNHKKAKFEFESKTVIVGGNGTGKSNLLEAIYLMATGKSFRADREDEMIAYGQQVASAKCEAMPAGRQVLGAKGENNELEVVMTDGTVGVTRKKFEVNGIPRRMMDFVGLFRAVLFGPEDMELVTGSPGIRRKYLDFVIWQADREYRRCLVSYEKGLRQRNRLLDRIREGMASRSQLFFWDKLLIKNGNYLTDAREKYLNKLPVDGFSSIYDKSEISESRLKQYEVEEVAAAATLVGPHRDDFIIAQISNPKLQIPNKSQIQKLNNHVEYKDVSKYGSRGEQRMAVMWLKRGELEYLSHSAEATRDTQQPVLLLDDIFSELDHKHRSEIEKDIQKLESLGGQVIMTTADEHNLPEGKDWQVIRL